MNALEAFEPEEVLSKGTIVSEFSEHFGRPDEHQKKLRRKLQEAGLMKRALQPGRPFREQQRQGSHRECQDGLANYLIATLQDAPLAECAALTLQTIEAPLSGPVLYRPMAAGGWTGGRSMSEIMEEGGKAEDTPFPRLSRKCLASVP
jgi:hypothetical protein